MSVTSSRIVNVQQSGDGLNENNTFAAASNTTSPARIDYVNLASGANTISTTTGMTAVTIIPPATNTQSIQLKGITGDTGVRLHNTDPTSLALDATVSSFVLTASGTISGMRLVWS